MLVVVAAALLVIVPLGFVWLLTLRGSDGAFSPDVGTCVKQSGTTGAVAAQCDEANAFTVVSKEDTADKCADKSQPHIVLAGDGGKDEVLCLKPAASG
ncbi:LppU/SCO3897 family protein [Phytohabitans sp. LJ34]|uniref:LppU/SCO3897 family protein n=1 Tax=Phytohabitans sp. LJ34 TaxID=3452217 RepID=UPI003F8AD68F